MTRCHSQVYQALHFNDSASSKSGPFADYLKFRSNLVEDLAILGTQELKKTTDIIKKMAIVTKCMFLNENLMENQANVCIGTNCTCIGCANSL